MGMKVLYLTQYLLNRHPVKCVIFSTNFQQQKNNEASVHNFAFPMSANLIQSFPCMSTSCSLGY